MAGGLDAACNESSFVGREVFGAEATDRVRTFHSALLPATLRNAFRTDFYQQLWHGIDLDGIEPDQLHVLPVVGKSAIRAAGDAARIRNGLICDEVFTSGTTGTPLVTVRGNREQAYIREFFTTLIDKDPPSRWRRGLQIRNPYHGHQVAIPAPVHFHSIGIYDAGSFAHGRAVLAGRHLDAGVDEVCSLLIGLERCLRAFTADTAEHVPHGIDGHLDAVVSFSQYLTKRWRERMELVWRAPVIDRYSLAELFGGASSCLACGWWHADPFLIPEVVGARSGGQLREGVGILVLTALYPFQEAQPMVRYDSRDLVEVTHSRSCRPGEIAFKPLGRSRYGVPDPESDDWLLAPAVALEAVDELEDIARTPRFLDAAQVSDHYRIGHPRYRVTTAISEGRSVISFHVQARRRLRGAARRAFADNVGYRIVAAAPNLASALDSGVAGLRVVVDDHVNGDLLAHSE